MQKILMLGLLPEVVDFSRVPGLTREKLSASLANQERELCDLGFDAKWCLVDRGETAESVIASALAAETYDVVLIGAGVRTLPEHFLLFERLVNVVHERAPGARLCFNTKPDDTREAVLRWTDPEAAAGRQGSV
jgi:hypothetical protein